MTGLGTVAGLQGVLGRLPSAGAVAVVRDEGDSLVGVHPSATIQASGAEALDALDALETGWWAGFLAYDLGRAVERVSDRNPQLPLPDLELARFDVRIRVDGKTGLVSLEGDGEGRDALERLLDGPLTDTARPMLRGWTSSLDRERWNDAVAQIHRHLVAGDCYQVNLTRRLECASSTDPVALFGALTEAHAPHAALVRFDEVALVSASPECFLRRDRDVIRTRPIKGTATDPVALLESGKDRAENVMIVDLSRNDLGRVCEYGSISVPDLFTLEQHPGLYHLVSTVTGKLRRDVTTGDIIRATFPPASVTGCPKPRVLEIIESLEPVRRGAYCGAIGFIDADNDVLDLNVAIRTFTIADGVTSFGVGGGIVADSDAGAEWEETELKARRLLDIAAGSA